jgi:restriction endonuclease
MISDDEYLERLVAGIHAVSTGGADVRWNEELNGRQFDVVVRFKMGTLRYLVLIEVKNRARKASAEDLDAFVTKARDQNANQAVFVTAAGFQSGAIEIAKRHGIEIFTITFDEKDIRFPRNATLISIRNPLAPKDAKPEFNIGEPELANNIVEASLIYADGSEVEIPSEQSQMNYYFTQTKVTGGSTLGAVICATPIPEIPVGESRQLECRFDPVIHLSPPDEYFFLAGDIQAMRFKVIARYARPMRGNIRVDPSLLTLPVVYTNAVSGEETRFSVESLPLSFERILPGKFYFTVHPLAYFYCETIKGNLLHWILVETFQNGQLVQARCEQEIKYSRHYISVSDKTILNRLQGRLDDYRGR